MRIGFIELLVCLVCAACGDSHEKPPTSPPEKELPVRSERDDDCDGTIDRCTTYRRQGNETLTGNDVNCDDVPDSDCNVEVSAPDGTIERSYLDDDCDGIPDRTCVSADKVNGHGTGSTEVNCDGVRTECVDTRFDSRDRLISFDRDDDCDSMPERCLRFSYDADGAQHLAHDSDCDGTPDTTDCQITVGNAVGLPTFSAVDADCDGTADGLCTDTTYSDGPSYSFELTLRKDADCDGTADWCSAASFDDDGRTVRTGWDSDCDGVIDAGCTIRTLDDQDRVISERSDGDCVGLTQPSRCWLMHYDAQGRYAGRSLDTGCTGMLDWCETPVYADDL